MTHRLYDMKISRVSLVKAPASRRKFLLFKSAGVDGEMEDVVKAVDHHLDGLLTVLGENDAERRAKIEELIDLMQDDDGVAALNRLLAFLRTAQELRMLLTDVVKEENLDKADDEDEYDDEDEDDQDDDEGACPDRAWWERMERKIRSLDGPIIVKGGTDMANTVEVNLGGGHVLQAEKSARIRSVVERALHDAAGVEPNEERRDPRTYSDRLLKAVRNRPEVRALYGLHAELARAASLNGDDPTVEEFLARPRR